MFRAYIRHLAPNVRRTADQWWALADGNTREGAHEAATRMIREMNRGRKNPSVYEIAVVDKGDANAPE